MTERYILGAWLTLQMAQQHNCRFALLTEGSPSCGSRMIYSGRFDGSQTAGSGVTAELLIRHGVEVFSDREIEQLIERVEYCDRHADA
ncbi:2 YbbK [Pectobacterium sp. F1-1]|nr:2 YbbK [Pectobacterium sp. F1-1]